MPDWNERYREGDVPWDSGIPSRELAKVLDDLSLPASRVCELGCGSGTNSVWLAGQGHDVTGFDFAPLALEQARNKADAAGVGVDFRTADLADFEHDVEPFDFVFDRGCYHCVRRVTLSGFLRTLWTITRPGAFYLVLTGNADEQNDTGIPKLERHEIPIELGGLFEIKQLREFHFEDAGGVEGPLGWSCLAVRRDEP